MIRKENLTPVFMNPLTVTLEVANNPWIDFIGMFEGDEEFAELAQELRDERELDVNH